MFSFLTKIEFFGMSFDISYTILVAIRTLFAWLCGIIYDLIVVLYELFVKVSTFDILDGNDFVSEIYRKIGLILGLFMIFKLSFTLVKNLIDPNSFNDKKEGYVQIVKRAIISIILLGVTPTIFKEAFEIQDILIGKNDSSDNILYKLIIGKDPSPSNNNGGNEVSFGRTLASDVYLSFFDDEMEPKYELPVDEQNPFVSNEDLFNREDIDDIEKKLRGIDDNPENVMSFQDMVYYATLSEEDVSREFYFEFNGFFCLLFGAIIAWMLVLYIIQIGIRVVQLAYLQLIAPIPIFSYIADPNGAFEKWLKQCVSTYLDLFIRMMIIYFVVRLSNIILPMFNEAESSFSNQLVKGDTLNIWIKMILILGLLLFAKKVPELLKDLFPSLGTSAGKFDFGLKSPKKAWNDYVTSAPIIGKPLGWFGNKVVGGTAKWVGGKLKQGAVGIGKWAAKPVTVPYNNVKDYFKERKEIKEDQVKAAKEERKNDAKYNLGKKYVSKYSKDNKPDKDGLSKEFTGAYKESYDNVLKHKKNVKNTQEAVNAATRELEIAKSKGDTNAIVKAQNKLNEANKNHSDAETMLTNAKNIHALNMRKKEFENYAKIENAFNYASDIDAVKAPIKSDENNNNYYNYNINNNNNNNVHVVPSYNDSKNTDEKTDMMKKVDKLTGVDRDDITDNGAPTSGFSAIAEKYSSENAEEQEKIKKEEEAKKYFDELNGVIAEEGKGPKVTAENSALLEYYKKLDTEEAERRIKENEEQKKKMEEAQKKFNELNGFIAEEGNGPKVTAENSIFVKLAKEAEEERALRKEQEELEKQLKMQEEFKNRNFDDIDK